MNDGNSVWDRHPELLTQLKELNATGEHSMRDIAKILGHGLTRNAVGGKLDRMNITVIAKASTQGRVKSTRPPRSKIMAAVQNDPPDPEATPVKNGELEYHHCKFPIGDPATTEFRFCGGKRRVPLPYCGKHLILTSGPQNRHQHG